MGKISKEEWAEIQRMINGVKLPAMPPVTPVKREPLAFGYARCSHKDSAVSNLSIPEQERAIQAWWNLVQHDHPGVGWGGVFKEPAVSAYKNEFFSRPEGRALNAKLMPGDHIIFSVFNRAFRSVKDCIHTLEVWDKRGIIVHFADLKVDRSTAAGKMIVHIIAAVAQMDSDGKSEKITSSLREARRQGRPVNGHSPIGFRKGIVNNRPGFIPTNVNEVEKMRNDCEFVVRLRETTDLSFRQISDELEKYHAAIEHRLPLLYGHSRRTIHHEQAKELYYTGLALRNWDGLDVTYRNQLILEGLRLLGGKRGPKRGANRPQNGTDSSQH